MLSGVDSSKENIDIACNASFPQNCQNSLGWETCEKKRFEALFWISVFRKYDTKMYHDIYGMRILWSSISPKSTVAELLEEILATKCSLEVEESKDFSFMKVKEVLHP